MGFIKGIARVSLGVVTGGTSELIIATHMGYDMDRGMASILTLGASEAAKDCRKRRRR
jgi:hypothetical protein